MKYLTTIVVTIVLALSFASGAPQMRRHRRHEIMMRKIDPFRPSKVLWNNSCGPSSKNDTFGIHRSRTAKPLKGLRNELPNYINRLNDPRTQAINTDDISQWLTFNHTYSFLAQINATESNIHLRKRHIETQVYVGAFQYLRWKQQRHDAIRNDDNNKTNAFEYLLILAKNLLCEIETAINNTGMKMPMILSKEAMHKRLTFRNNFRPRKVISDEDVKVDEVDEIDSKFAKIRFSEYLNGLQQVLRNRMGKQHHHIGKKAKKNSSPPLKKKNRLNNTNVAGVPKINKPIDKVQNVRDNDIDDSITATKRHHTDLKHRLGFNKQNRNRNRNTKKNRKQIVASLKQTEINLFRNHRRNSTTKKDEEVTTIASTTTTTTTVTPAPQSQIVSS